MPVRSLALRYWPFGFRQGICRQPSTPRLGTALLGSALLGVALLGAAPAAADSRPKTALSPQGQPIRIHGRIVIVEPDIELSLMTAGGMLEPRREWSEQARRLYPEAARRWLQARGLDTVPDHEIPDDLPADSRLGQVLRLNRAVAMSIIQYSEPGSALATKRDPATGRPRMDWSLGPGVGELREATGADYALFTHIRDSYASDGRKALALFLGGGLQAGISTLVDLRTGQVVWLNLMANQSGDLRDAAGATTTVERMLEGFPR